MPQDNSTDERFTSDIRLFHFALVALGLFFLLLSKGIEGSEQIVFIWSRNAWADVVRELGFALLIAAAISLTVEVAAKREYRRDVRRYTEEIKRDVFGAVFGTRQPREIVDDVMELMLQPTFIRRDHSVRLEFDRLVAGSGTTIPYIVIRFRRSYTAKNTTGRQQRLSVRFQVVEPPFEGRPADTVDAVHVNGRSLAAKWTSEVKRGDRESTVLQSSYEHEELVEAHGEVSVVVHSTLYRDWDDNELTWSSASSEGLTFSLKLLREIKRFGVVAIHQKEAKLLSKNEGTHEYEYCIPGPVLPYQGMYLWWRCLLAPAGDSQKRVGSAQ
jgi:hypothetical protein